MYLAEARSQRTTGIFMAATAVKGCALGPVADALVAGAHQHGLLAGCFQAGGGKGPNDIELFACPGDWVILRWFKYCTCHVPVSQELSARLGTAVCTVDVYGDVWRHVVFNRGRVADRFVSNREQVGAWCGCHTWTGDPHVIASVAGGDPSALAPYLVEATDDRVLSKAHPEDLFDLGEPSVFIDLWRRIGIRYPGDDVLADAVVRYGADWEERLPYESADF